MLLEDIAERLQDEFSVENEPLSQAIAETLQRLHDVEAAGDRDSNSN